MKHQCLEHGEVALCDGCLNDSLIAENELLKTQLSLQRDRNKALEHELTNARNYSDVLHRKIDRSMSLVQPPHSLGVLHSTFEHWFENQDFYTNMRFIHGNALFIKDSDVYRVLPVQIGYEAWKAT